MFAKLSEIVSVVYGYSSLSNMWLKMRNPLLRRILELCLFLSVVPSSLGVYGRYKTQILFIRQKVAVLNFR